MLNTFAEDECTEAIHKASLDGELDGVESWICPECGQEWRVRPVGETIRHWAPHESIEVF